MEGTQGVSVGGSEEETSGLTDGATLLKLWKSIQVKADPDF